MSKGYDGQAHIFETAFRHVSLPRNHGERVSWTSSLEQREQLLAMCFDTAHDARNAAQAQQADIHRNTPVVANSVPRAVILGTNRWVARARCIRSSERVV